MEQAGMQTRLWHARILGVMTLLASIDVCMLRYTLPILLAGPNMLIFFGVEYVILAANLLTNCAKYIVHSRDAARGQPWEEKSMYLFYLEVFSGILFHMFFFGGIHVICFSAHPEI
jgi:hypothetical protein